MTIATTLRIASAIALVFVVLRPLPAPAQSLTILKAGLVTAQMTDAVTTTAALSKDVGREGNPLMSWVADKPLPFALLKAATYIASDLALSAAAKRHPRAVQIVGWSLVGFYGAVSIRNARIAARAK